MVYWTEWGKTPKLGQYDLDKNVTLTFLEGQVTEPNGLFLDQIKQLLYVGDAGKRTVFQCPLNGKDHKRKIICIIKSYSVLARRSLHTKF